MSACPSISCTRTASGLAELEDSNGRQAAAPHIVIDLGFVAELAEGLGVDQHLAARGRGPVRDDLGIQVAVALVEGGQGRACMPKLPSSGTLRPIWKAGQKPLSLYG